MSSGFTCCLLFYCFPSFYPSWLSSSFLTLSYLHRHLSPPLFMCLYRGLTRHWGRGVPLVGLPPHLRKICGVSSSRSVHCHCWWPAFPCAKHTSGCNPSIGGVFNSSGYVWGQVYLDGSIFCFNMYVSPRAVGGFHHHIAILIHRPIDELIR